jgi:hypothetical protein
MAISFRSILLVAHLIGMALGMGAATAKASLLLRARLDRELLPTYLAVARPITRLILVGIALLTVSGVGWLLLGYRVTPLLIVKLTMVGAILVLGPLIDRDLEPAFRREAPRPGEGCTPAFVRAEHRYIMAEMAATALFYVIVVIWVLR